MAKADVLSRFLADLCSELEKKEVTEVRHSFKGLLV